VAGRVNRIPAVPVRTIGAGGGSLGWLDPGGALRVGPRSAGAIPGPAAYGLGGIDPTVTDANVVVGNLPESLALGGSIAVDGGAARDSMAGLAAATGMSPDGVARGMLDVVDSHMEHAIRAVSVEEGSDPRHSVLVAFGGAGGLHACRLARRLEMSRVVVPPFSGVFSALGLLLAAPRADAAATIGAPEGDQRLIAASAAVGEEARARFRLLFGVDPVETGAGFDCRYRGQSHELEVVSEPRWEGVRSAFEAAHAATFGFTRPGEPIEVVNVRGVATGRPMLEWGDLVARGAAPSPVHREGAWLRPTLPPGFSVTGPTLIVEADSAVLLGEGDRVIVLDDGSLEITLD
jgi:N-methylhydantoinase A/oxoprolinase/acetone carboxylase beta subunit